MPFCVNCGAQNPDGARFCQSCGKLVTQLAGGTPPPATPTPQAYQPVAAPTEAPGMAKTLALVGVGVYGVGALLSIMGGDMWNFILSLLLAAGIYMAVYVPLTKGNAEAAKKGALTAGVVCLVFVAFSFIQGGPVGALFNAAAAACMGLAWNAIKS
jgi:hypothetical protein